MNFLIGLGLLLLSTYLFYLVVYLLKRHTPAGPDFLQSDIITEDDRRLLRLQPVPQRELQQTICSPSPVSDNLQSGIGAYVMSILREAIPGGPVSCNTTAYRLTCLPDLIERLRSANYPSPNAREILIVRTRDRKTRKISDGIKLRENLINPEFVIILWHSLVIAKAMELLAGIASDLSGGGGPSTGYLDWLGPEYTAGLSLDKGTLTGIASAMRAGSFRDIETARNLMDDMDGKYADMLSSINEKALETGRNINISNDYKEEDTLKVIAKYEEALNVYLIVLNVRMAGAVLGALTPVPHNVSQGRMDGCRKALEETQGQLTMMLKIVDSANSDQFFGISQGEIDKAPAGIFSLLYPAYLLQELLKWYKKLRVTERIIEIKDRLQVKFWDIEARTNEMLKIISDAEMFTKEPLKGEISFLVVVDENGLLVDMKKIVETPVTGLSQGQIKQPA